MQIFSPLTVGLGLASCGCRFPVLLCLSLWRGGSQTRSLFASSRPPVGIVFWTLWFVQTVQWSSKPLLVPPLFPGVRFCFTISVCPFYGKVGRDGGLVVGGRGAARGVAPEVLHGARTTLLRDMQHCLPFTPRPHLPNLCFPRRYLLLLSPCSPPLASTRPSGRCRGGLQTTRPRLPSLVRLHLLPLLLPSTQLLRLGLPQLESKRPRYPRWPPPVPLQP
mmetsp:Transcript_36817/g.74758  ORF Transcript_36817/g.74758 Transcript_36817/m.74758 type:complete len:220 (+) Transcript_36817:673-1332(+)